MNSPPLPEKMDVHPLSPAMLGFEKAFVRFTSSILVSQLEQALPRNP